jgi:hypothetical protein
MAFLVVAVLMLLGVGGLMLQRQSARHAPRPTGQAALDIASRRARWAIVAIFAASIYQDVLTAHVGMVEARLNTLPWAASAVSILLGLGCGVVYLAWLYRAVANTMLLRAPIKWAPGKAVAAYFIPFIGLYRPYQVMKALHAASDPTTLHDAPTFRDRPVEGYREPVREPLPTPRWSYPAPIGAWWILYNLRWVWSFFVEEFARTAAIAGMVTELAAAVMCALVVRSVDARQRERFRRLEASRSAVPSPSS